ncbi:endonuclease III [Calorimonas adulescens]|jgi:DNA-(apurinic or apyrimidinic site) lyase (EC 4.2.99.18)/endonuclease III (EC 3.2.2.-)|uniref:Endonuclease III n=1 Tax=Calorimonas adulescens TaxID=2606906 RepID=A0A5D8QC69_9THEO|nr:endonuclease III [Calorimonas adulescens]TZE80928.1 endonuclease III [Calorimonas adulescens]
MKIFDILKKTYPDARTALNFSNPFELLIATILSAQCTDKRVNEVTRELFKWYRTPEDYLKLGQEELEKQIRSCGFYHNKAKNILETCRILVKEFGGKVPSNIDDLMKLPGVGRKTANVVMSNAFGIPAIGVDTHVFRVSHRLGLSDGKTPERVEEDLMALLPVEMWSLSHHLLIYHGRNICHSRKPQCDRCPVNSLCRYFLTIS